MTDTLRSRLIALCDEYDYIVAGENGMASPADLSSLIAAMTAAAQMALEDASKVDDEQTRCDFESSFRALVAAGSLPGEFSDMADFWFDRIDGGRYEWTRLDDAWNGWKLHAAHVRALAAGLEELKDG